MFSLEKGVLRKSRRREGGHMVFDERSYEIKLTRATAQMSGHTVSDFTWLARVLKVHI